MRGGRCERCSAVITDRWASFCVECGGSLPARPEMVTKAMTPPGHNWMADYLGDPDPRRREQLWKSEAAGLPDLRPGPEVMSTAERAWLIAEAAESCDPAEREALLARAWGRT